MTRDRDIKRRIRALMKSAEINYTTARSRFAVATASSDQSARRSERQPVTTSTDFTVWDKFTDRSRKAIVHGQHCAFRQNSEYIEPLHLLEGVTYVDGHASRVLQGEASSGRFRWSLHHFAELR